MHTHDYCALIQIPFYLCSLLMLTNEDVHFERPRENIKEYFREIRGKVASFLHRNPGFLKKAALLVMAEMKSFKISCRDPISPFLCSPRLFTDLLFSNEPESFAGSPTSILDVLSSDSVRNPFCSEDKSSKRKNQSEKFGCSGLADVLLDQIPDSKCHRPIVLFGSKLRVRIPPLSSVSNSPPFCGDFGLKTRKINCTPAGSLSPNKKSPFGSSSSSSSSGYFTTFSLTEMELSEDYTRVISYGPNPKTTHIFDDSIVESFCGVVNFTESRKEKEPISHPPENFLSFCHNCRKNLDSGTDIYRGEKGFCRSDCRQQNAMFLNGETEDLLEDSFSDIFGSLNSSDAEDAAEGLV